MDRSDLVRWRWRLSGAWLWPSFLVLTLVDAAIVHLLPPAGDSEGTVGAWLVSTVLMLLAVVFLTPPLSVLVRRVSRGLPKPVARNYAGTFAALGVSLCLLAAGVVHHHSVSVDRAAMLDASQRAEAWIGAHARAQYLVDLHRIDTVAIEAPKLYRSCVSNALGTRSYCVVVNRAMPFGSGVSFSGYESNELLEQGAN